MDQNGKLSSFLALLLSLTLHLLLTPEGAQSHREDDEELVLDRLDKVSISLCIVVARC